MNRATSIYLDFLRCIAAMGVFLGHAAFAWFSGGQHLFPALGHELVIVFFFLSGYVIADATLRKGRGLRDYVAARFSRLYSVVGPAVLLTALLARVGGMLAPDFYAHFTRGHESVREMLAAVFCQELWFTSASPPSNAPLWSLGYEFWYYVIFGCWVFATAPRYRWLLAGLAALLAGPKIVLLLPVWLLGVFGWAWRARWPVPRLAARAGFWLSLVAAIALVTSQSLAPVPQAMAPWFYSAGFLSDWLLGALVLANVGCFERAFGDTDIPDIIERPVRAMAGVTFSLYAYHFPLIVFCAAVLPYRKDSALQVCVVLAAILLAVVGLQAVTERQRPKLRRLLLGRALSPAVGPAALIRDLT